MKTTNHVLVQESAKPASELFGSGLAIAGTTFLLLSLWVFLGVYQQKTPALGAVNLSPTEFSVTRAMAHIEAIAQKPHPLGSAEDRDVSNYIVSQLTSFGLNPEIQSASVVNPKSEPPMRAGSVRNIVARLRGTQNSKALMLVSHYDSVPNGPGASDDGAGVASMLETLRAQQAGPPLKNDLIFLFTDGEEPGLLGAKAFVDEQPWAKDVGVVLNFEARGSSGPLMMFETSERNGWLIEEFAKAAPHPVASSLMYEIYRRLPNDTDLTIFKASGLQGLNFAYINGLTNYHTQLDRIANVDQRSLQHEGVSALALVRHFGGLNLENARQTNAVYFNFPGLPLVHYSARWVAPLTILTTLVFVLVLVLGFRSKQLTLRGIAFGFVALLLSLIVAPAVVTLVWWSILRLQSGYRALAQGDTYNSNLYKLAFVSLTIAIVSALYVWFRKRTAVQDLVVGALLGWLILTLLTGLFLPGASYLFVWPLLFSLIGIGFVLVKRRKLVRVQAFIIVSLCAIPVVILLASAIDLIFMATALNMPGAAIVPVVLATGLLIPQLHYLAVPHKWVLPATALLCSLGFITAGSLTAGFDQDHPKQNTIFYVLNADTGKAVWASTDERVDEWTSQFLSEQADKGTLSEYLPFKYGGFLRHPALVAQLAAPQVELLDDSPSDSARTMRLHISSPRRAPVITVYIDSATEVLEAAVNGKPIKVNNPPRSANPGSQWTLQYWSPPDEGIELSLKTKLSGPVKISVVDRSNGLPDIPGMSFKPRPDYMIPAVYQNADTTLVNKSFSF